MMNTEVLTNLLQLLRLILILRKIEYTDNVTLLFNYNVKLTMLILQ